MAKFNMVSSKRAADSFVKEVNKFYNFLDEEDTNDEDFFTLPLTKAQIFENYQNNIKGYLKEEFELEDDEEDDDFDSEFEMVKYYLGEVNNKYDTKNYLSVMGITKEDVGNCLKNKHLIISLIDDIYEVDNTDHDDSDGISHYGVWSSFTDRKPYIGIPKTFYLEDDNLDTPEDGETPEDCLKRNIEEGYGSDYMLDDFKDGSFYYDEDYEIWVEKHQVFGEGGMDYLYGMYDDTFNSLFINKEAAFNAVMERFPSYELTKENFFRYLFDSERKYEDVAKYFWEAVGSQETFEEKMMDIISF